MNFIELNRVGVAGILLILVFGAGYFFLLSSDIKLAKERLRVISAFSMLEKALNQAIEGGKRIHISPGRGGVFYLPGAATFAGLKFLKAIYQRAGLSDRSPTVSSGEALVDILAGDAIEGIERRQDIRRPASQPAAQLKGLTPFSFAAGAMPAIAEEDVQVNVFAGHFGSELGLMIDSADPAGIQVFAASENLAAQAVLAAMVEDPILGEELFAAGAYLHGEPGIMASLLIQDIARWGIALVILVGIILRYLGIL